MVARERLRLGEANGADPVIALGDWPGLKAGVQRPAASIWQGAGAEYRVALAGAGA